MLVFTSSSLVVNAAEVDTGEYHAYVELLFDNNQIGAVGVYPFDGTVQNKYIEDQLQHNQKPIPFWLRVSYAADDTTSLFVGGKETTVRLENIYLNAKYQDDSGYNAKLAFNHTHSVLIFYANGEMEYMYVVDDVTENQRNDYVDISFSFTPAYDVVKIETILEYTATVTVSQHSGVIKATIGESTDDDFQLSAEQDDGTKGLLAGIIEWLSNIWDTIENGFSNMLNAIKELPSIIADRIKGLFVPDREELLATITECREVYLDKFGFLGEIADLIGTFIADCLHSDRIDSITIPEVSIDLPEDKSFSFGGQTVKIVPDGFGELVGVCKGIVGIMCTFLFVNGMRKRYDEIMGVEK